MTYTHARPMQLTKNQPLFLAHIRKTAGAMPPEIPTQLSEVPLDTPFNGNFLLLFRINSRRTIKLNMKDFLEGAGFHVIRGISRQIIEIHKTQNDYFERALFFVNPEMGGPGKSAYRRKRGYLLLRMAVSALAGAAVAAVGFLLLH